MKKKEMIRRDLRDLRRITHSINTMLALRDHHQRRIAYLTEIGTSEAMNEAEKIKKMLDGFKIEESIAKVSELEAKYMDAIGLLNTIDRTIIIEGYINGRPFWMIGKEIGYSVDSIKKKAGRALEQLSEYI